MKKLLFSFLFLALGLAGCETDIDVPVPPHTPRTVLLYVLRNEPTTDTLTRFARREDWLYISKSQDIFSPRSQQGRSDAKAEIVDQSGGVVEEFRAIPAQNVNELFLNGQGYYRPVRTLRGQPGQTYTLRATAPNVGPAEATLTMPYPAVIEAATLTNQRKSPGTGDETQARLTVTVQDNAATTDYYLATARLLDAQGRPGSWEPVNLDYNNQEDIIELGRFQLSREFLGATTTYPYADGEVNGKRFTLSSDVRFSTECYVTSSRPNGCPPAAYLEVTVSTLTLDAYRFLQSNRRYADSDLNPFGEPAPLYSNIRNGYGIFAGLTDVKYRIKL